MRPKVIDLKKIKIGAVNYLNTKPLLYGIRNHEVINHIELIEDYPARIADMLLKDDLDVGLVPVAIIPELKNWNILGNYCIGCDGPVASVCLFSEVPMEQITTVVLDYQSRTSVILLQIVSNAGFNFYIKEAASIYSHPFIHYKLKQPKYYDVQLNIFCFKNKN